MTSEQRALGDERALQEIKGLILDLDGVVYRGEQLISGARSFLESMSEANIAIVALTNHSGLRAEQYVQKLDRMGIKLKARSIVTSGFVVSQYLQSQQQDARLFVVGTDALRSELLNANFTILANDDYQVGDNADFVVVGFDDQLNFGALTCATEHLLNGAKLVGTNPDRLLPVAGRFIPECGPNLAYLESASGQTATVLGKPNPMGILLAAERLGLAPQEILMVGDTLETDIAGGNAAGVGTVLVLTGNTTGPAAANSTISATATVADLNELRGLLLS